MNEKRIVLAGGCFWGMEKLYRGLPGVLDATVGFVEGDYRVFEHNNLNMVIEITRSLRAHVGRFCISHMARTLHTDHAALAAAMAPYGIEVAFDGYEIEL